MIYIRVEVSAFNRGYGLSGPWVNGGVSDLGGASYHVEGDMGLLRDPPLSRMKISAYSYTLC